MSRPLLDRGTRRRVRRVLRAVTRLLPLVAVVGGLTLAVAAFAARPVAGPQAPAGRAAVAPRIAAAQPNGAKRAAPAARRAIPARRPPRAVVVPGRPRFDAVRWRRSRAVGLPFGGRLVGGVRLPAEGRRFFTWDPVARRSPNAAWRRWGTARLIRVTLRVLAGYAHDRPAAPRVGIGDLSRPHGGSFGRRYGGLGHASHQNGLDVDVLYPRKDGRESEPARPSQIDTRLAQDLVDRFVRAGAQFVFVGHHVRVHGPAGVVQRLAHHDDHMHVRIR